jgi:hypothetical protein
VQFPNRIGVLVMLVNLVMDAEAKSPFLLLLFPKEKKIQELTSKMQNFQGLLPLHAPALTGMCGDEASAAHRRGPDLL